MKVTALIFCLALVPFVAAQAEAEQPNQGFLDTLRGFWEDFTSNVEVQRYREDATARFNMGVEMIKKGWNQTQAIIEDLKVEAGEFDFPTAEETQQQIAANYEELDQMFTEMQNSLQAKFESLKKQMPALQDLDFLDIIPDGEDNENEEEAVAEPEPTPETESGSWKWW